MPLHSYLRISMTAGSEGQPIPPKHRFGESLEFFLECFYIGVARNYGESIQSNSEYSSPKCQTLELHSWLN